MERLLECVELTKYYGARAALEGVSLCIDSGHIIGLLGPNGSGKTTLIKLAAGILSPSSGAIRIDGKAPGVETKALVSYLPDRNYLDRSQTSADMVDYFSDFYADFDGALAVRMIEELGIDPMKTIRTLSKGTTEKLQLILVMSRRARLYLLDEPIGGVDPAARDYIIRTIIGHYSPESTVLISTHLIRDIEDVLDEAVFLREGRVFLHDSTENIRKNTGRSVDQYFREVFAC